MLALIDAMNVAYHETESRGFVRRTALGLSFVLQSSKTTSAGSIHVWGALKDLPASTTAPTTPSGWDVTSA